MTIAVPAERVENEVNKRLQQTAKRAKVAGFRPGKVPMSVIRQRFEADARQEAFGDLVQASFYEAIVEQKLNPAGAPAVEPKSFEKGKDLEFVAIFEVFPEFTVSGLESIKVERLSAEVADADPTTCWKCCASRTYVSRPLNVPPRTTIRSISISLARSTAKLSRVVRPRAPSWCWAPAA